MNKVGKKLRRALFLIPYVAKHPGGVPIAELAALLDVEVRELAQEIKDLTMVGVPQGSPGDFVELWTEGRGPSTRVFARPTRLLRRPPRLTAAEALALLLGASALHDTGIAPFDEALGRAEGKIRGLLRGRAAAGATSDPTTPVPGVVIEASGRERHDVIAAISRASRERRAVELDYASLTGQRRMKIVFEPYGLLNHRGGWYVLGKSLTHAEDRIFPLKIERTLGARILDRAFTVPRDFDLRQYAGERLFIAGLAPVEVKLRLRAEAARRLGASFKNARRERGGALLVRFKDHATGWLAAWILRQGPDVEVVAPPNLATWVGTIARRVADAHG